MNEVLLAWGFGLFAVAVVLLVLEMFIPSGGVIGAAAAISAIAGLVCFWRVGTMWGLSTTLATIVLAPLAVAFMFKMWPHTPIGRRLILGGDYESGDELIRAEARRQQDAEARDALIGKEGVALTDLHPIGAVRVGGERYEALAQGGLIDEGEPVRIVGLDIGALKVRRAT